MRVDPCCHVKTSKEGVAKWPGRPLITPEHRQQSTSYGTLKSKSIFCHSHGIQGWQNPACSAADLDLPRPLAVTVTWHMCWLMASDGCHLPAVVHRTATTESC